MEPVRPVGDTEGPEALLKEAALRAVKARAGTDNVGYPTHVVPHAAEDPPVWGCPVARIDFSHTRSRVCPLSRIEHDSNHFFVALGVEPMATGLPAFLSTATS